MLANICELRVCLVLICKWDNHNQVFPRDRQKETCQSAIRRLIWCESEQSSMCFKLLICFPAFSQKVTWPSLHLPHTIIIFTAIYICLRISHIDVLKPKVIVFGLFSMAAADHSKGSSDGDCDHRGVPHLHRNSSFLPFSCISTSQRRAHFNPVSPDWSSRTSAESRYLRPAPVPPHTNILP